LSKVERQTAADGKADGPIDGTATGRTAVKRSFIPVAFASVILVLGVSLISPADLPALTCAPDSISIATWNIRILSDGSRDDGELRQIARILERYDVIAVQELRDPEVVARLLRILPDYDAIISDPVGRGVTERYAVFFRNTLPITILEEPFLFPDPADQFIREPWVVWMRAGEFDFILVTIHVIYGDRVADRRAEISLLDDLLHAVESSFPEESDILLLGDFNRDATDEAWEMGPRRAPHLRVGLSSFVIVIEYPARRMRYRIA